MGTPRTMLANATPQSSAGRNEPTNSATSQFRRQPTSSRLPRVLERDAPDDQRDQDEQQRQVEADRDRARDGQRAPTVRRQRHQNLLR